jgi:hypothetical protein
MLLTAALDVVVLLMLLLVLLRGGGLMRAATGGLVALLLKLLLLRARLRLRRERMLLHGDVLLVLLLRAVTLQPAGRLLKRSTSDGGVRTSPADTKLKGVSYFVLFVLFARRAPLTRDVHLMRAADPPTER